MALADRYPEITRKGPTCATCELEAQMTPADRATLHRWWDNLHFEVPAIATRLAEEGYEPPPLMSMRRHRARKCQLRRQL